MSYCNLMIVLLCLAAIEFELCESFTTSVQPPKRRLLQTNPSIELKCKEIPAPSKHLGRKNAKLGNFHKSDPILKESSSLGKAVYSHTDWAQQYISVDGEFSYWIDTVDGKLPPDLVGSLFRNGPARFDRGGQKYASLLDGDGYISRFTFLEDQRCHYTGKFVRTREFLEEELAGKICWRGTFGTQV